MGTPTHFLKSTGNNQKGACNQGEKAHYIHYVSSLRRHSLYN